MPDGTALSSLEYAYLKAKYEDERPSFQTFLMLCQYFRGRHHVEEIMQQTLLSRSQLSDIFHEYQDVLVQTVF